MARRRTKCANCGKEIDVRDSLPGDQVVCACGSSFEVPPRFPPVVSNVIAALLFLVGAVDLLLNVAAAVATIRSVAAGDPATHSLSLLCLTMAVSILMILAAVAIFLKKWALAGISCVAASCTLLAALQYTVLRRAMGAADAFSIKPFAAFVVLVVLESYALLCRGRQASQILFFRLLRNPKVAGLIIALLVTEISVYMLRRHEGTRGAEAGLTRLLGNVELATIDLRFLLRGPRQPGPEIVIAAIDEKSLRSEKLGRWPWDRSRVGELVHGLVDQKVRVIAFDVLFMEPQNAREDTAFGSELERALARDVQVILAADFSLPQDDERPGAREPSRLSEAQEEMLYSTRPYLPLMRYQENDEDYASLVDHPPAKAVRVSAPIDDLVYMCASLGYVNYLQDYDGQIRRERMAIRYKDGFYAPLALEAARRYRDFECPGWKAQITWKPASRLILALTRESEEDESAQAKDGNEDKSKETIKDPVALPLDRTNAMRLDFCGGKETFPTVSIIDILEHPESLTDSRGRPVALKDKIVFVGMAAAGLRDTFVTPYSSALPGVEKHATVAENILHGRTMQRQPRHILTDFGIILFCGLSLGLLLPRVRSIWALVAVVALLGGHSCYTYYQFTRPRVITNFIYPACTILLCYGLIVLHRFMTEERAKRQIRGLFERYLDPEVVKELAADPAAVKLGGEVREITAFFSDVQGFSAISEKLSAEEVIHQLNDYLTEMSDIVLHHRGLVDKFEGDAIVALFNAPNDVPRHAVEACHAAIEIQHGSHHMRRRFADMGRDEWHTRIGLNTGPATVGNVGTERHMGYTMIGDEVNLAARLEGANKQYGTYTMISKSTYEQAKDEIDARELDLIRVVGKNEPVRVYELIDHAGHATDDTRRLMDEYAKGLAAYRKRDWDQAIRCFESALETEPPDPASRVLLERCRLYRETPPPDDWAGVFALSQK